MRTLSKKMHFLAGLLLLATLAATAATTPRPLLDVTLDGANGTRYRPAQGKGKIRLIAILSSSCEHCTRAVATLNRINSQYKSGDVQIFGALAGAYTRDELTEFVGKTHPNFAIGTLTKENTMRVGDFKEEDKPYAPILLFVNRANAVTYQLFGDDENAVTSDVIIKGILDRMLKDQK